MMAHERQLFVYAYYCVYYTIIYNILGPSLYVYNVIYARVCVCVCCSLLKNSVIRIRRAGVGGGSIYNHARLRRIRVRRARSKGRGLVGGGVVEKGRRHDKCGTAAAIRSVRENRPWRWRRIVNATELIHISFVVVVVDYPPPTVTTHTHEESARAVIGVRTVHDGVTRAHQGPSHRATTASTTTPPTVVSIARWRRRQ